jgi:hypothetical protein
MALFCSLVGLTHTPGKGHQDIVSVISCGVCGRAVKWSSSLFTTFGVGGHPCHQVLALAKAILHNQIFIPLSHLGFYVAATLASAAQELGGPRCGLRLGFQWRLCQMRESWNGGNGQLLSFDCSS